MDPTIAAVLITVAVSLGGSWLVARGSSKSTEHARIVSLEKRVDTLEASREKDAVTKRRLGDHIDLLEWHIWQGSPPPPPPRPEGI